MTPLEQPFRFEVEFHRQFRETTEQRANAAAAHARFALQNGHEAPLRIAGRVTGGDVEAMKERLALAGDPRDVLAARGSLRQLLGISTLETRGRPPLNRGGRLPMRQRLFGHQGR